MARKTKVHPFSYDPDSPKGKWFDAWKEQLKTEHKNVSACILDRLYYGADKKLDSPPESELVKKEPIIEPVQEPAKPKEVERKKPNVGKFFK